VDNRPERPALSAYRNHFRVRAISLCDTTCSLGFKAREPGPQPMLSAFTDLELVIGVGIEDQAGQRQQEASHNETVARSTGSGG
jgi:hypothetical protein